MLVILIGNFFPPGRIKLWQGGGFFMAWRDVKRKVKRRFSEILEIPGDVALDLPKIILVGNIQLFIENHRGILEYSPDGVRVSVGEGCCGRRKPDPSQCPA